MKCQCQQVSTGLGCEVEVGQISRPVQIRDKIKPAASTSLYFLESRRLRDLKRPFRGKKIPLIQIVHFKHSNVSDAFPLRRYNLIDFML